MRLSQGAQADGGQHGQSRAFRARAQIPRHGPHGLRHHRDGDDLQAVQRAGPFLIKAAFIGAFFGKRLLKKVTLRTVQIIVAACMIGAGGGLAAGLI